MATVLPMWPPILRLRSPIAKLAEMPLIVQSKRIA